MNSTEILIVAASLVGVHLAGMVGSRRGRADFVLAGRSLSVPMLVATLVATWYGAILASGEFILRYGIVFVLCFGIPYYAVAVIYSVWLAGRVRDNQSASIPEQLGLAYGPSARRLAAVLLLVITVPASYQLMLGHLISYQLGWPLGTSIIVGTVISVAYVIVGGLRSDVYANVVQSVLMFLGMGLLVGASVLKFGGPEMLLSDSTRPLFSVPGSLGWGGLLSWFVIAMQTFIDPNFYVRSASAANAMAARRAILWSVVCWVVFDMFQLTAGLYAARFLPEVDAQSSYLVLSSVTLPDWGRGIVVAGIIAAISSTLSGYALVSATTIADDVLPTLPFEVNDPTILNRIGLLISTVIGAIIAISAPSFVDLILHAASIAVSALLIPMLLSHTSMSSRYRAGILGSMILPAIVALVAIITDFGEPALLGLLSSALIHAYHWMKGAWVQ